MSFRLNLSSDDETSFSASFSSCFMDFFSVRAWKDFSASLFAFRFIHTASLSNLFRFCIACNIRLDHGMNSSLLALTERNWAWTFIEHSRVVMEIFINTVTRCSWRGKLSTRDSMIWRAFPQPLTIYLTGLTFRFLLWTPLAKRYYKQQSGIEKKEVVNE